MASPLTPSPHYFLYDTAIKKITFIFVASLSNHLSLSLPLINAKKCMILKLKEDKV